MKQELVDPGEPRLTIAHWPLLLTPVRITLLLHYLKSSVDMRRSYRIGFPRRPLEQNGTQTAQGGYAYVKDQRD